MSEKSDKRHRLAADSVREVVSGFQSTVIELQGRIEHNGRKLAAGPALNGLVCHFLSLTFDEQVKLLSAGLRRYERLESGTGASTAAERARREPPKTPKARMR